MATSFKKKGSRAKLVLPSGTRPSLHNNQLLISSGVPSLDNVIGGGIAVGSVFLIEEDTYGSYARQLMKYFLAEGVVSGHSLFLATAEGNPDEIFTDLPQPLDNESENQPPNARGQTNFSGGDEEAMRIAWRYQNLPKFQSHQSHLKFGHYYDLTKTMDEERLSSIKRQMFSAADEWTEVANTDFQKRISGSNPLYDKLLKSIKSAVNTGGFGTHITENQQRNILRLALQGLGGPLWGENPHSHSDQFNPSLCQFLYCLRATLRAAYGVCLLTVPTHIFQDPVFKRRIERLCDTVVALESFAGSDRETNPIFKDYHGLFHIVQLPRLNSLSSHVPDSLDLAFKLKRKKLTIEKLHLPPELSETASRTQEDPLEKKSATGGLMCQSSVKGNLLDF